MIDGPRISPGSGWQSKTPLVFRDRYGADGNDRIGIGAKGCTLFDLWQSLDAQGQGEDAELVRALYQRERDREQRLTRPRALLASYLAIGT
jgi:hypothetical protein